MGKLIEAQALEKGHKISMVIDPYVTEEKTIYGSMIGKSIQSVCSLKEKPDMAIEFTRPDMAVENIRALAAAGISAVIGTTGWYDKLPEAGDAVKKAGTSLLWAANFSLGVNLFYRIAEFSAELFDPFPEYDVGGMEIHHNKKADSPSGTAKIIAEKILSKMTRKKKAVYEKLDRPPAPDELHFSSLRVGSTTGVHSVIFDSPSETIEITHSLRNRDCLAAGALKGAEWLGGKKRQGIFTIDDMLTDILLK